MISLVRLKRLLAILIALVALAVGMFIVRAAAETAFRSASGADPTSIFKDVPPVPGDLLGALAWRPDPPRDGRAMEPTTRVLITDSYARALSALDRAGRGDPDAPLADYLSGTALETALDLVNDPDAPITSTFHLGQELRLDVYSDDGSVVAIGVPSVEIVRAVDGAAGRTITTTFEEWRFTMLLEDGNWRIQQLQTVDVEPPEVPSAPRPFEMATGGVNIATVGGDDHTWTDVDDDDATIADLDAAVELGFDTVRVFVAGPEADEIDLDAFAEFLDLAAERGLGVIPVLFEDSHTHHQVSWRDDVPYLEDVVAPLADHEAIVLWDLKNAPDLEDEASGGSINVDAWLVRVASFVRQLDADTPVTVGWSSHEHASRIANWVDVASFQHIGEAALLSNAIDEVATAVTDRPILLTGFGTPEFRGRIAGAAPSAQARDFATLLAAADRPELVGSVVWQLRDPALPYLIGHASGAASTSYGLLRHDGTERATAAVLREGPTAIPVASRSEQLRSQRLLLAGGFVILLVIAGVVRDRIRRRRHERWESHMMVWLAAGMLPTRRSKLRPWRRVPVKPGRRGRILWWRRRQPWPAPESAPIDPIGYIAEQVLAEQERACQADAAERDADASDGPEPDVDDPISQPSFGPAFGLSTFEHAAAVEHPESLDDEDLDDEDLDEPDDDVWSPPDDIADVDATAVAWVEGALTGMVRQTADAGRPRLGRGRAPRLVGLHRGGHRRRERGSDRR